MSQNAFPFNLTIRRERRDFSLGREKEKRSKRVVQGAYRLVFLAQRGEKLVLGDDLLGLLLDEVEVEQQQLLQVLDLSEIIVTGLVAAQRTNAESGGRGGGRRSTVGHAGVHMIEVTWETEDASGSGGAGGALALAVHLLKVLTARAGAAAAVVAVGTAPDVAHRHHRGGRIVVAGGVRHGRCHHRRGRRQG